MFLRPLAVFACWRLAQLAITWWFDSQPGDGPFRWDGGAYRRILESGYHVRPGEKPEIAAFFPGLAWITRAVDVVVPSREVAEFLTINVVALLAFVAVFAAIRAWRDDRTATGAIVLLALFPSSVFLSVFYSEVPFVALSAGAFWADRRGKKWLAAVLACGAAATRTVGIAVAGALVVGHLWREHRVRLQTVVYAVAGAVGLGAVMLQQQIQLDDPLGFVHAEKYWGRKLDFPWSSIREGVGALRDGAPRLAKVLDLVAVALVVGMVLYVLWKRRRAWPVESWLFVAVTFAVPLFNPFLAGINRYVLTAWPVFGFLSDFLDRLPRWVRWAWYVASGVAAVFYARYWARGTFVA
ncbi:MAG: mannosyltransferase family protein [Acidimicrobiia bacterium]